MGRSVKRRWAIFVHEPDGDSGLGAIVGPFHDVRAADSKANVITTMSEGSMYRPDLECIVLPLLPGSTSASNVMDEVST